MCNFSYQVDDGTSQTREGTLVLNDEGDDYVLIQKGSYSYISPEGIKVTVTYTADKEGFKIVESSNEVPARVQPESPQSWPVVILCQQYHYNIVASLVPTCTFYIVHYYLKLIMQLQCILYSRNEESTTYEFRVCI